MKKKWLSSHKTGMAVGAFAAVVHLGWLGLVLTGLAQPLLDFIYDIHFLDNPFVVQNFDLSRAIVLIIVVLCVGYAVGWVFAIVANSVQRGS